MEKQERDILEKLDKKTNEIKVPDRLKPENIENLLKEQETEKKRMKKMKIYRFGTLAAACLALMAGVGVYRMNAVRTENVKQESDEAGLSTIENAGAMSASPKDYEKVYAYIEKAQEDMNREKEGFHLFQLGSDTAKSESAAEESADMVAAASTSAGASYSETNLRQAGVDEGDVVKTDGRYLYVLKENTRQIVIVDTKGGLKAINKIKVKDNVSIQEFYLLKKEKKLIYIANVSKEEESEEDVEAGDENEVKKTKDGEISTAVTDVAYMPMEHASVQAVTMDISNPKSVKELGNITQSGCYTSSRIFDGCLYLFSDYQVPDKIVKDDPKSFVPLINDAVMEARDICLPPFKKAYMYEVVTAVNLEKPSESTDTKAIFTSGGNLYVSNENIYYYETNWADNSQTTTIRKIGYKNGKLSKAVQTKIRGYINDSFSIDEYKGYLRIVATIVKNDSETNAVYVLDQKLKTIGSIKKLAKDERVYSARLFGDTGYFVTFRETDPLFSVDFSDPKNPKILGKLKIPGFSEYLHFWGKDKLIGIGMSVEDDADVTEGVKVSMFDISDPKNVKEENTFTMKNVYGTDVSYDYKSVLIDAEKNLIGFSGYTQGGQNYYLFSYDEKKGFECKLDEELNGDSTQGVRGIYIEDTLYVVCGNVIESYSLKEYKKVEDLVL